VGRGKMKIMAVIPCYNEGRFIGSVVLKTKKYVDNVLVVDDGSCDETSEIAKLAGAQVIRHECNMGKGIALNTGINKAKELDADVLVLLDGDYQHNPDEIPSLITPIVNGEADIVIGSRFLDKDCEIPRYRKFGEFVLTRFSNVGSKVKITDSQCGFRALSKKAIEKLDFNSKGFSVESEMQFLAPELGLRIKEVPVTVNYKDKNKRSPISHGLTVLSHIISLISEKRPLFFFGISGIVIILLGIFIGLSVVEATKITGDLPVGTALISTLLCIIGTITLFIGIVLNSLKNMIMRARK